MGGIPAELIVALVAGIIAVVVLFATGHPVAGGILLVVLGVAAVIYYVKVIRKGG